MSGACFKERGHAYYERVAMVDTSGAKYVLRRLVSGSLVFVFIASTVFPSYAITDNLRLQAAKQSEKRLKDLSSELTGIKDVGQQSKLILYSGPSAVGKGPLWKQLKKIYPKKFDRIVLYTSRKIRSTEVGGVDYRFRSAKDIQDLNAQNPAKFATMVVNGDIQDIDFR